VAFSTPKGADRFLELAPGDVAALDESARAQLLELRREALAAMQADRDPVLASVARREAARAAPGGSRDGE
jgi:hypothetical protein